MPGKGDRYERQLVTALTADGWFAQRAAASGGGASHELPDVLAARDGRIEVIELKFTSDPPAYVSSEKVAGLRWLATQMDATPRLCLRLSGDTSFYCVRPQAVRRTPGGRFALDESMLTDAIELVSA